MTGVRAVLAGAMVAFLVGGAATVADDAWGSGTRDPILSGAGEVTVQITIEHSRFVPDTLRIAEGTVVRFVVDNRDPILHELVVGPPEVHARHADGTEAFHPPVPGEVTVEPNATASTVYVFDEPGTVTFACHLPGHVAYGMTGTVEVVPR